MISEGKHMNKLKRSDLYSLEQYSEARQDFRSRVIAHKINRKVLIGPNAFFIFEDQLTIQYQIQEMLRVERIFEAAGIEEELAAYNPLIPDGSNLKATFMLEYEDPNERQQALAKLLGIEDRVWIQVEGYEPIFSIADEDLDRANDVKTSSVHFLRFEFSGDQIKALKEGKGLGMGIDHPEYKHSLQLDSSVKSALINDFS